MTLVLRDVTVVDVVGRRTLPGRSVHVHEGRITRVAGGAADPPGAGGDVEVVECGGRYLMPGLTDSHVHLRATPHVGPHSEPAVGAMGAGHGLRPVPSIDDVVPVLHGYLYCGVTSLFDAGNFGALMWPLREAERSGEVLSPRIHCAGPFVTCTGGHGSEFAEHVGVDSLPEDGDRLRAHLRHQPDLVKITYDEHNWGIRPLIPILTPETLHGVVDASHEAGIRVTVHVSNELRAREAIRLGADTLAHPVIQSPATDDLVSSLAAEHVPVVSTLAIGERYVRLADDPSFLDGERYVRCLDPHERQRLMTAEHEAQRANRWADWMRVMTPVAQENLRRLVEAGGVVAPGSDLSLGPDLLRELELLQGAGIEPWDVLACATVGAARFLGKGEDMGAVETGKVADLVLVDRDPTTDVSRLSEISMVMKAGRIVDRAALQLAGEPSRSGAGAAS